MLMEDVHHAAKQAKKSAKRASLKNAKIEIFEEALTPNSRPHCSYSRNQPDPRTLDFTRKSNGNFLITPKEFKSLRAEKKIETLTYSQIPKVIHQTAMARDLEGLEKSYAASWLRCMPDWHHVLWDDDDILELFMEHRPDLVPLYESYPFPVQRADMFRYVLMEAYGGLYMDMDYEWIPAPAGEEHAIVKEMNSATQGIVIMEAPDTVADGTLQNSLVGSYAGHPFWTHTLEVASSNCGRYWNPELVTYFGRFTGICSPVYTLRKYVSDPGAWLPVLYTTGPRLLSEAYQTAPEYQRRAINMLPEADFNGQELDCAPYVIHHNNPQFDAHQNVAHWDTGANVKHPYTGSINAAHKLMLVFHRIWFVILIEAIAVTSGIYFLVNFFQRRSSKPKS